MLKVIGIGDNVVDKYVHTQVMYPGGNALNFSVYAKQLGAETAYLGVFGSDEAAAHITKVLKSFEIDISHSRYHEGENGYAKVNIADGDRVFVGSNRGGVAKMYPIILSDQDLGYIQGFDLVHTSCYSDMEYEIVKIKEVGVPVSFDFSNKWDENYLIKVCPHVDFSFLSCGHMEDNAIKSLLETITGYGSKIALATMGSRGAMLYDGIRLYTQKPDKVDAIDTLGAGDSFITSFLLNFLTGQKNCDAISGRLAPDGVDADDDPLLKGFLQYCKSYWEEQGGGVEVKKGESWKETVIRASLLSGAVFAAKTCMVDGAFGYGVEYSE